MLPQPVNTIALRMARSAVVLHILTVFLAMNGGCDPSGSSPAREWDAHSGSEERPSYPDALWRHYARKFYLLCREGRYVEAAFEYEYGSNQVEYARRNAPPDVRVFTRGGLSADPLLKPLGRPENLAQLVEVVEYAPALPRLQQALGDLLRSRLGKPPEASHRELLDYYRQNAGRLRWDIAKGVFVVGEAPVPGDLLPEGFVLISEAGMAEDGYPLRIRCVKDDAEMVYVPPGRYWHSANEGRWIEVGRFYIDRFEVTNRQYLKFCQATRRKPPKYERKSMGDLGPLGPPKVDKLDGFDLPELPVTCILWDDAAAYAAWAGKTLPSRDEWLRAAHGDRQQSFPWGELPEDVTEEQLDDYAIFSRGELQRRDIPEPVGGRPAGSSPFGAEDMAGNVAEFLAGRSIHGDYLLAGGSYFTSWPSAVDWTTTKSEERMSWWSESTPWNGFRCVLVLP